MVKLVDTLLLGSSANASRFESEWRYSNKNLSLLFLIKKKIFSLNFTLFYNLNIKLKKIKLISNS